MPCKMIAPVFAEMSTEVLRSPFFFTILMSTKIQSTYADVLFLKVDVDEVPEVTEKFQVAAMPTFIFIKNNEVVDRFSGASVEKLRQTLISLI